MEHHSSYSAPRSSRASGRTRSTLPVRISAAHTNRKKMEIPVFPVFYYATYFHFSGQSGNFLYRYCYTKD